MISKNRSLGGSLPFVIEPFGPWVMTSALIADLPALITMGSLKGQKSAAEKLKALIRKNIRNNGVPGNKPWSSIPYSSKYEKEKAKAETAYGVNSKLRRTGLYYRSISVWSNGHTYYIGIKKGVKTSSGGKTLGYVAQLLEKGSSVRNIKARPLWAPTFKQFGGNKRIKSIIVWHIARLILVRHGVRVQIY